MAIAKGTQQPVVYDEAAFNSRVEVTRTCHIRSHEGAAEAAANAYIFTRETSDAEGLALFQTAIADYNAAITKHNKGIDDRFERADKFQAGKLSPDDPMYSKPDDPALLKAYEDERVVLLADHSVDKADRRKLKRVTAEKKEDANRYTAHVKYVLGFDRPSQATLVNSYCLALEWIDANCGALPNVDVPVIKMAVLAAGAFQPSLMLSAQLRKTQMPLRSGKPQRNSFVKKRWKRSRQWSPKAMSLLRLTRRAAASCCCSGAPMAALWTFLAKLNSLQLSLIVLSTNWVEPHSLTQNLRLNS
ncbi:hypothetical protein WOC76_04835 [Methylocystis sp. IM3]|uniref:hypothetical protein n=1 Tax=unclassified Methylocystis TaxID=2625913 RepID=UPI0030F99E4F